jgi:hypothetical protein
VRTRPLFITALALLALSGCGTAQPTVRVETTQALNGTIEKVTFPVNGLDCTTFDTVDAGGVTCDWASFEPAAISAFTDESVKTPKAGSLELVNLDDRVCVALDGINSGGIDCAYLAK